MVIIKGEIKTSEIMSCGYNRNTQKWDVKFNNGKTYSYAYLNVDASKTAGQGFGSATGQYLDLYIKFDTRTFLFP